MSAHPLPTESALRVAMRRHNVPHQRLADATGLARWTIARYLRLTSIQPDTRGVIETAARELFAELRVPFPSHPWDSHVATPIHREATPDSALPEETMSTPSPRILSFQALQHFKLPSDPFEDSEGMRLHLSARTKFNRAHLVKTIQQRRMAAIIAHPGGGKSTLLRLLHSQIKSQGVRVLWLTPGNLARGTITETSLASAMLRDLGQECPNTAEERGEALRNELERRCKQGDFPTLVIDEAQDLGNSGLIAVKRIWDSFTFHQSLAVILAGQPALLRRLRHDSRVEEVAGRTLVVEIPPMSNAEVRDYINHRCSAVGVDGDALFTDAGVSAIHVAGGTAPLWINAICQGVLDAAWPLGLDRIDTDAVSAYRR